MRVLALLVVLALLPTIEVVEQAAHVVEHVLAGEAPDHDAHHDEHDAGDEHGCTPLVHLCGGHQGLGMAPGVVASIALAFETSAPASLLPLDLTDLATREPMYRPPIA